MFPYYCKVKKENYEDGWLSNILVDYVKPGLSNHFVQFKNALIISEEVFLHLCQSLKELRLVSIHLLIYVKKTSE